MTHGFAADLTDAGARALNAGVDMEMAIADPAYAHLPEAVERGRGRARRRSTRACGGCSRRSSGSGLFDDPYVDEDRAREVLADPAHREVARVAAERSAVLLRNEGDLLPLDAGALSSIAVIGPLADSRRDTLGPWVLRLRPGRDGHRAGRHPRPGSATASGSSTRPASGRRSGVFPSMFDMFGGNAPEDPEGFDDEAEFAAGGRPGPRRRRRGRRGRRVAEHDRRGGVALVAGAARPPARAAAGRRRDRHARSCCW